MESIITHTAEHVSSELEWLCSAHDYYHIERVWKLSRKIHADENAGDIVVIELSALLHESFDEKFHSPERLKEKKSKLREFLVGQWLDSHRLEQVFFTIENIGYGKSLERGPNFVMTPELAIVEDADRLDAIGAIAIARTFAYGGKMKRPIYDPEIVGTGVTDRESYRNSTGSSVQHFYDKLLKLKDLLHTDFARKLARERHEYMETYLERFFAEWNLEV